MESNEEGNNKVSEFSHLEQGLHDLYIAMKSLREMESEIGRSLAGIVRSAIVFGEAMRNAGDCDG